MMRDADPDQPHGPFPLHDYAALGDGRSLALVGPDGAVAWWCVPNIDSVPLFDALLDPANGGRFTLAPVEPYRVARRYRRDSNVLETTFNTGAGTLRLTESMNSTLAGRLPWCELARRIEVLEGTVRVCARLKFGLGADKPSPWLQPNPNGTVFHVGSVLGLFRATDNLPVVAHDDHAIVAEATLAAGERAVVALIVGDDEPLGVPGMDEIDRRIDIADDAWRAWAEGLHFAGPRRDAVRRSALVLKLLLYSPSGAIAAAATTSLPEQAGGAKNWDYRYAWVRDAGYAINAFLRLRVLPESKAAFTWLMHRLGDRGPRVCYRLDGGEVPGEREIELPGWRGSSPVRTGNRAAAQHQHGIYGDIFETAALFVAGGNVLDTRSGATLAGLADECADRWRQKDAGMWELDEPQHYTMSKVSAWQALARAVELSERGHLPSTSAPRWARERDRILAWVEAHCWSETKGAYALHAGSDRLDASLALAVRFGFDNGDRLAATLDAIRRELGRGPWLYRYSGMEDEEGAFVACTFWMVEALATLGRRDEAEALMTEALAALPDGAGLIAEMVDVDTGAFLGNLPQGLSHLALIHAAHSLDVDPDHPLGRRS